MATAMPDFQYEVSYSTQVILPLVLSGGLGLGSLFSFYLYNRLKEKPYLSVTAFQLCAFFFVFCEAIVNVLSDQRMAALSFQFCRIEHLAAVLFIPVMPWLFYTISEETLPRFSRFMVRAGSVAAGVIIVAAFLSPDLFISVTHPSMVSLIKEANYGRGMNGVLYSVRDGLLAVVFLHAFIWIWEMRRQNRAHHFSRYLSSGVVLTILFSLNDIVNAYTQHNILLPRVLDFSYTTIGFTLFALLTMFGVFKMFIRTLDGNTATLRKIQRMALIGGVEWRRRENMLFLSEEFRETFHIPEKDALIPLPLFRTRYVDPDDHERFDVITAALFRGDSVLPFLCRIRPQAERLRYAFFSSPEIVGKEREGLPAHILWSVQDTTERKETEKALIYLRNYLANIIDSMPSVIMGVDREGRVTQWNLQAQRITGIQAEEAQGRPIADVFPRIAGEMEKIQQSILSREVKINPREASHTGHEIRYEDVTIYPLIANGVEGAVIRVDDVTETVRLQEMMIQSEKMLSVGGLAAGMAHEINNPLAGIMQNTEVILRRITTDMPANDRIAAEAGTTMAAIRCFMEKRGVINQLELIQASGKQAVHVIRNMLSFARKGNAQGTPHSLSDLLDKTIEIASHDYNLETKYDFRGITIVREYDRNLPDVMCESSEMQQVFFNILKNGAEAMTGSRMETAAPRLPPSFILKTWREGRMACLEIRDNGPGMAEAVRKRAFEPFFTTKEAGKGTGLGLSVSYFIITEHHGGEMRVISEPGQGTAFIIKLPIDGKRNR